MKSKNTSVFFPISVIILTRVTRERDPFPIANFTREPSHAKSAIRFQVQDGTRGPIFDNFLTVGV